MSNHPPISTFTDRCTAVREAITDYLANANAEGLGCYSISDTQLDHLAEKFTRTHDTAQHDAGFDPNDLEPETFIRDIEMSWDERAIDRALILPTRQYSHDLDFPDGSQIIITVYAKGFNITELNQNAGNLQVIDADVVDDANNSTSNKITLGPVRVYGADDMASSTDIESLECDYVTTTHMINMYLGWNFVGSDPLDVTDNGDFAVSVVVHQADNEHNELVPGTVPLYREGGLVSEDIDIIYQ